MPFSIVECSTPDQFFKRFTIPADNPSPVLVVNGQRVPADDFVDCLRQADGCVADFDGTLTGNGTQWQFLRTIMLPADKQADEAQARDYSLRPDVSEQEVRMMILSGITRLVRAGMTQYALAQAARGPSPRLGAVDLLNSFGPAARVAIVSIGVKPLIERWCVNNGLEGVEVFATELEWQGWNCVDCHHETVVTDFDKGRCLL